MNRNKIWSTLTLVTLTIFVFTLVGINLVSATEGYGEQEVVEPSCDWNINLIEVLNNNGSIQINYDVCGINESEITFGISVFNELGGSGSQCARINTSNVNDSYEVITACSYPLDFENKTIKVSATCQGCKPFPANLEIIEEVEEPEVVEPVVTPTPNENSGGSSGGSRREVCEEWTVCENGKQTQSCDKGKVIKSRTCESTEPVTNTTTVVEETGDGIIDETAKWERTGAGVPEDEPKSKVWLWVLGIIVILAILGIILYNRD